MLLSSIRSIFLSNATPTTEIYTLSLHDALPICLALLRCQHLGHKLVLPGAALPLTPGTQPAAPKPTRLSRSERLTKTTLDRKSTRLNSSHVSISYAVFCLKKKRTAQCDFVTRRE